MNIAIVGSRDYVDLQQVTNYVNSLPDDSRVISGGARGVDNAAKFAALERWGLRGYREFPANWAQYGKQAGYVRNYDIVAAADLIVAFWDGKSKGTAHTIEVAKRTGKKVIINPESYND